MKKLLVAILLAGTSTVALADGHGGYHGGYGGYHGGYNHYHGGGWGGFVGPALIGGVIGYELGQPRYVQPAPTVIYQPQVAPQTCTAWIESVDQYGAVTKTRTCY